MVTSAARGRWTLAAALLLAAPILGAPAARADDFAELVAAERAFAADATARNIRSAFLAAMADDSMMFAPGPVDAQRHWTAKPVTTAKLEWAPEAAEVAASGELGYTYGPWRFTPEGAEKPAAFGHFLTVWQKQADGRWRALADKGITHAEVPLTTEVVRRGQLTVAGNHGAGPTPTMLDELRHADLLPPGRVTSVVVAPDFLRFRPGELPRAVNESPALDLHSATRFSSDAVISQAGDLAATWGGSAAGGTWLRVWRRAGVGDPPGAPWRLVADMSDVVAPQAADE